MTASDGTATHDRIMRATYRALCANGYAGLTTKTIADEAEMSTGTLHYHYDTKEGLLVAFLEHMLDVFADKVAEADTTAAPSDRLSVLVEKLLFGPDDYREFQTAMLELQAQAPYSPAYRKQLRRNDLAVAEHVVRIVQDGIDTGVFRPVDPEQTATLLLAIIDGARTRAVTLGDDDIRAEVKLAIDDYLTTVLLADGDGVDA